MPNRHPIVPLFLLLVALSGPPSSLAAQASAAEAHPEPFATTPQFAFYSDFDTNLHDALLVAGSARRDEKTVAAAGDREAACRAGLAPPLSDAWRLAVDFYAAHVVPGGWNGKAQVALRFALAGVDEIEERDRDLVAVARGLMAAAAPAYRSCSWAERDAANRAWQADLAPLLATHGMTIADRLAALYATPWHGLPLRVDVVAAAPPLGANTWILHRGGHILISTTTSGERSLENVFHEASHTLVAPWRPDPLAKALTDAAVAAGVNVPRDLWHVVLFYTTGEVVRETLAKAGTNGYVPIVSDLWRGSWAPLRGPIETVWPAYLQGQRTLQEAAAALVAASAAPRAPAAGVAPTPPN